MGATPPPTPPPPALPTPPRHRPVVSRVTMVAAGPGGGGGGSAAAPLGWGRGGWRAARSAGQCHPRRVSRGRGVLRGAAPPPPPAAVGRSRSGSPRGSFLPPHPPAGSRQFGRCCGDGASGRPWEQRRSPSPSHVPQLAQLYYTPPSTPFHPPSQVIPPPASFHHPMGFPNLPLRRGGHPTRTPETPPKKSRRIPLSAGGISLGFSLVRALPAPKPPWGL